MKNFSFLIYLPKLNHILFSFLQISLIQPKVESLNRIQQSFENVEVIIVCCITFLMSLCSQSDMPCPTLWLNLELKLRKVQSINGKHL